MTWSGIRASGFERFPLDPFGPGLTMGPPGALVAIEDGPRLVTRRMRPNDVLVRLGWKGAAVLTPGLTLEEELAPLRMDIPLPPHVMRQTGNGNLADGDYSGDDDGSDAAPSDADADADGGGGGDGDLARPSMGADRATDALSAVLVRPMAPDVPRGGGGGYEGVLVTELRRALTWLDAHRSLGTVALLGPLPFDLMWAQKELRSGGYLDETTGRLTTAGWWRLAYGAEQGVGVIEKRRAFWVSMHGGVTTHTRQVQRLCANLMREGAIPLGLEYSATAEILSRIPGRYRSDALLVGDGGELIWVEVMRRPLSRLGERGKYKYRYLEASILPVVALGVNRRVRYILQTPAGIERDEWFEPSTDSVFF